jgi:hypothetical protein
VEALSEQLKIPVWEKPIQVEHSILERIGLTNAIQKGILPVVNDSEEPVILLEDPTNSLTISFLVQERLFHRRFITSPSFLKTHLEELIPISDRISRIDKLVKEMEDSGIAVIK